MVSIIPLMWESIVCFSINIPQYINILYLGVSKCVNVLINWQWDILLRFFFFSVEISFKQDKCSKLYQPSFACNNLEFFKIKVNWQLSIWNTIHPQFLLNWYLSTDDNGENNGWAGGALGTHSDEQLLKYCT